MLFDLKLLSLPTLFPIHSQSCTTSCLLASRYTYASLFRNRRRAFSRCGCSVQQQINSMLLNQLETGGAHDAMACCPVSEGGLIVRGVQSPHCVRQMTSVWAPSSSSLVTRSNCAPPPPLLACLCLTPFGTCVSCSSPLCCRGRLSYLRERNRFSQPSTLLIGWRRFTKYFQDSVSHRKHITELLSSNARFRRVRPPTPRMHSRGMCQWVSGLRR